MMLKMGMLKMKGGSGGLQKRGHDYSHRFDRNPQPR